MTDNPAMKRHVLISSPGSLAACSSRPYAGCAGRTGANRPAGATASPTIRQSSRNIRRRVRPMMPRPHAYWDAVSEKRRGRNVKRREHMPIDLNDYVLTQPPIYSGPPRPVDPRAPAQPPPERPDIPVVADFLQNASEQFGFVPDRPANELDFKRAYAKAALAPG